MDSPTPPPVPPPVPNAGPVPPAGPAPAAARGWWSRNWKWFVPTGCLTLVVINIALVGGIIMLVFGAMKSSDVYKAALHRAKADPRVVEALGKPIKDGI